MTAEFHVVTIEPPDFTHIHWLVSCSFRDLTNRPATTRAEAKEIAFGHVSEVHKRAVEEETIPAISTMETMDDFSDLFKEILRHPLDIDGKE